MYTRPKHVRKHRPEFEMPEERTRGERWHEEALREDPLLAFLTFALAMITVIGSVVVLGSQPSYCQEKAYGFQVTPQDPTNWVIKERWDHDRLKRSAAQVKEHLDSEKARAEEEARIAEEERLAAEQEAYYEPPLAYVPQSYSGETGNLRYSGVESDGEYTYTWYSQNVLPGGNLDIPGRHVGDGGYVMDGDGNIVVASSDLAYGTEVETPYGNAKVYDTGCASGVLDVYTNW